MFIFFNVKAEIKLFCLESTCGKKIALNLEIQTLPSVKPSRFNGSRMPPKSKMNTKACPDCDQPNAVASKTCVCGYSFYLARRNETINKESTKTTTTAVATAPVNPPESETGEGVRQRRTQRVKEKPNYYDATEFMKEKRKRRRSRPSEDQYELRRGEQPGGGLKRKRRRKVRNEAKEREEEEEVLPIGTSAEKTAQCSVILAELNRRMYTAAVRVR